jgi:CheY-like chemotaxis protein
VIAQVLLNLGGNAIKFSPAGSRVELRVHEAPQTVQFEVVDAGPGIAPEHQAKIFESFTQVDGSLTRAHGGTGLGLSIAKRLVELHGGTLRVRSALGRGSTFIAQFPRTAAKVEAPPSPSKTLSRPATIVVVDDEPMVVETLRLSLRHLALVEVIGVNDPEQALATIARHQPSLVVLDVMMPGTSGLTILRQLREAPTSKELPVLVLSAFATSRAKAEELGARWLAKPWNAGELAATVTELAALELRSPHPPAR